MYKQKVEQKKKLIIKHQRELNEMLAACPHEELIHRQLWNNGDYYNRQYVETWRECTACGKKFDSQIKTMDGY